MRRMTEDQAQQIADRVGATLVSVMRRLLGWPVRGRVGERIDAALAGEVATVLAGLARELAGEGAVTAPAPEASRR